MSAIEIEKRTVTSQKFKFVKLGIGQHIQKEQDEKSPLKKNQPVSPNWQGDKSTGWLS